ncbi:MAG: hypothetical protein SF051_09135, partial [Elusimicrobiota bacterium]|nr:hypothetical protein [Elusimicrobiota bacterium]
MSAESSRGREAFLERVAEAVRDGGAAAVAVFAVEDHEGIRARHGGAVLDSLMTRLSGALADGLRPGEASGFLSPDALGVLLRGDPEESRKDFTGLAARLSALTRQGLVSGFAHARQHGGGAEALCEAARAAAAPVAGAREGA